MRSGAATSVRSRRSTTAITGRCSASASTCSARARRPRTRSSTCSSPPTAICARAAGACSSSRGSTRSPGTAACRCCARAATRSLSSTCSSRARPAPRPPTSSAARTSHEILGDVARLPDDQRAALVLAELGDLSHDEIAATLDVRKDKVKALIFQAREALAGRRQARAADCRDIQEQLATLRGSALRAHRDPAARRALPRVRGVRARGRASARSAGAAAPGDSRRSAQAQRARGCDASAGTGAAAGGAGAGAGAAASAAGVAGAGASGLAAKTLAVAALAIGAGGGGVVAVRELDSPRPLTRPAATAPARHAGARCRPGRRRTPRGIAGGRATGATRSAKRSKGDAGQRGRSAKAPTAARRRRGRRRSRTVLRRRRRSTAAVCGRRRSARRRGRRPRRRGARRPPRRRRARRRRRHRHRSRHIRARTPRPGRPSRLPRAASPTRAVLPSPEVPTFGAAPRLSGHENPSHLHAAGRSRPQRPGARGRRAAGTC